MFVVGGGWVVSVSIRFCLQCHLITKFQMGNATKSWDSAYMCNQMLKYAKEYKRVLQIEYRTSQGPPHAPQGAFPAAIIDALMGYNYLVNTLGFMPSNILITGESAGGNLAFALTRYLVQSKFPLLPPPRAQFLLSPTADWGQSHVGPNSAMVKNDRSDFVHWFIKGYATRALLGNLSPEDMYTNSWISPGGARLPHVEGRFSGMPPTLIMAGDAEYTLDGMKVLRDRLLADNGEGVIKYIELPDTTHVVMTWPWHQPESTQAFEMFAQWVNDVYGTK